MSEPKRIQRRRTKGWRMPEGAVYVGRPSKWANPWAVDCLIGIEWPDRRTGDGSRLYRELPTTAELAVALFRIAYTPDAADIRKDLAGKDLACWCPLDQPCHADVLLEIANAATPSAPAPEPEPEPGPSVASEAAVSVADRRQG